MSQQILLSIELNQELYNEVKNAANQNKTEVNDFIIKMLEDICYNYKSFNYKQALETLIEDTKTLPDGTEFALHELPSFSKIGVAKGDKARLQPSTIRAQLGKEFNEAIKAIPYLKRAKIEDENGNVVLKSRSRAAVYVVDKKESSEG